ncbi:MAG: 2Fe-2S iron-sulfur cluster-binding protein [Chloroherpetonaceae bacterium]|nr:2Fe-2S iron-sulfur cluster-binding protein [Chthonomonadaceae bacterium]MDW8209423.1 2Fe-2S iron-sulfur cluster-binding protein [Chloroherpetonaceae bacterium]
MSSPSEDLPALLSCEDPARAVLQVTFLPLGKCVQASYGDTLLDAALIGGVPLRCDCGGNCACTTCHVLVRDGAEHLSPMEPVEADRLATADHPTPQSRLACQALIYGDVIVEIPGE